ncbi:DUF1833 family protein [Microvirga arsenatis]|uniref:DUF1833 domain-containing protein n=1 Tax=Microvirga arsenatis TaxID=2692265 RepID=A0ABW9YWS0_9HYPH|nr:DUF1833 domain-containing protein [Microvirga arsenatis]NBJ24131.1 DUF1833 domain-containing protein [Microvirga arsenatis]
MPISATQAWAEAAASAPKDEVMLVTIELIHPVFVENGQPAPIRAVRNTVDMNFRLEAGAPVGGGTVVLFKAIPFDIDYPRIGSLGAEATIRLDNVNRETSRYLHEAVKMNTPIQAIFRGYLASDPNTVGQGPYKLILRSVKRKGSILEGQLAIARPQNMRVMREVYDMVRFPSLLQAS